MSTRGRGCERPRSTPLASGAVCGQAVACSLPSLWSLKPAGTLILAPPPAGSPSLTMGTENSCAHRGTTQVPIVPTTAEVAEATPERAEGQEGVQAVRSPQLPGPTLLPRTLCMASGQCTGHQGASVWLGTPPRQQPQLRDRWARGRFPASQLGPGEAAGHGGRRCPGWLSPEQRTEPGSLPAAPGWADRAPRLPWPGGDSGPGPSQADSPPGALMAVHLSEYSQGRASGCPGARPQGDSGQMARNGRSSLLP